MTTECISEQLSCMVASCLNEIGKSAVFFLNSIVGQFCISVFHLNASLSILEIEWLLPMKLD